MKNENAKSKIIFPGFLSAFLVFSSFVLVVLPQGALADSSANFQIEITGTECFDGVDNDGDGDTDYPNDDDCEDYDDDNESSEEAPPPPPPSPSSGGGGGGGRYTPPAPKPEPPVSYDFNGDGLNNFRDLSMMLYWFGKSDSEISRYDFNKDKKINFVDISIFLYHWKDA